MKTPTLLQPFNNNTISVKLKNNLLKLLIASIYHWLLSSLKYRDYYYNYLRTDYIGCLDTNTVLACEKVEIGDLQ